MDGSVNKYTTAVQPLCRDGAGVVKAGTIAGTVRETDVSDVITCGDGVAIGLYGRVGEVVDALGLSCLGSAGTFTTAAFGGPFGHPIDPVNCTSGEVLTGLVAHSGPFYRRTNLFGVEGICSPAVQFSGVLQPINADGSSAFRAGGTVPVKFRATDLAGASVGDLTATLSFTRTSDVAVGSEVEAVSQAASTVGNLFRYDAISEQYIFNWSTKGLASGTYVLTIDVAGQTHEVQVSLR